MEEKKPNVVVKKPQRSNVRFAALDPKYNLKTRQEEIEDLYDYADQLNDEEKAWLNAFSNEEICANFNHKGPKLNDKSDPAARSRIYNRNNERNRCIMTREKAQGCLNYLEEMDLDGEEELIEEENEFE